MHDLQPENTVNAPLHDAPPVWQVALLSFLLVLMFAGPSYMLASSEAVHPAGLWIPIVGMFLLLLALAGLPELRRKIATPIMRRAVIYVLVVRAISLFVVFGFGLDIILGAITLRITDELCGRDAIPILTKWDDFATTSPTNEPAFLPTFIATCIQGSLLFMAFFIVLLLALPVARHQIIKRAAITPACLNCGYDLCMTPTRCPECGTEPTDEQREFMTKPDDMRATA